MTSRKINQSRKLSFQQTQNRQMMSATPGNVTTSVKNGTLTITGDNKGDAIAISQTADGKEIGILGLSGYTTAGATTINGSTSGLEITGVTGDININMGVGNDFVQITADSSKEVILPGHLNLNLGNGSNTLQIGNVQLPGSVSITSGYGDDTVSVLALKVGTWQPLPI